MTMLKVKLYLITLKRFAFVSSSVDITKRHESIQNVTYNRYLQVSYYTSILFTPHYIFCIVYYKPFRIIIAILSKTVKQTHADLVSCCTITHTHNYIIKHKIIKRQS